MIEQAIIYYCGGLLIQYTWLIVIKCFSENKALLNRLNIIVFFTLELLQVGIKFLNVGSLNAVCSLISIIILSVIFFDMTFKDSLYYSLIIWILCILIDIITMIIMNIIGLNVINPNKYLFIVISSLFLIFMLITFGKIKWLTRIIKKSKTKIEKININNIITTTIIIFWTIGYLSIINMQNISIVVTMFLIGISIIATLVYILALKIQLKNTQKSNYYFYKNEKSYKKAIIEYRIFKHNIESQLRSVKSVSNESGKCLIDEIIKKNNKSIYTKIDIQSIPSGINGIVMEKLQELEKGKTKIEINNKIKDDLFQMLGPRKYNALCESLGLILDNAIKACKKSKNPILLIEFYQDNNQIISKITNTFSGTIEISKIGNGISIKKDAEHGIGLFSIFKNKIVKTRTRIINNLYICELSLDYNNKK